MTRTLDAIYENGALRLLEPLELPEGARVRVALETNGDANGSAAPPTASGPKSPEEILAIIQEIAALPIEGKTDEFSGRDHDEVLYGKEGAA